MNGEAARDAGLLDIVTACIICSRGGDVEFLSMWRTAGEPLWELGMTLFSYELSGLQYARATSGATPSSETLRTRYSASRWR